MNAHYFKDNFLNDEQTNGLRLALDKIENKDIEKINTLKKLIDSSNLSKFILNENFINKIKTNLYFDDLIFLNRVNIQKNKLKFEDSGDWHQDSGKPMQNKILTGKNNIYFKVGVYLQDNDEKLGGGIDLLKPFYFDDLKINNKIKNFFRKIYYSLKIRFGKNIFKTRKGDIVGFSGLVFHRTTPTMKKEQIQSDRYSIYFLLGNKSILKDILNIYEKKNNIKINFEEQIMKLKFDNLVVNCCSDNFTKIVENIVSD